MPTDRQIYEHLTERGVLTGVQQIYLLIIQPEYNSTSIELIIGIKIQAFYI